MIRSSMSSIPLENWGRAFGRKMILYNTKLKFGSRTKLDTKLRCPNCGADAVWQDVETKDDYVGQYHFCNRCKHEFYITSVHHNPDVEIREEDN